MLDIVPTVEFPPDTPFTVQVTAVFDVPVTVALNCCVLPSSTIELGDVSVRVTDWGEGGGGAVDDPPPPHPQRTMANPASANTLME